MKYIEVCSLGGLCHVARAMQRIHVKKVSYPFDWVFSDESVIVDCISDNFSRFMDRSYYVDTETKLLDRSCGHKHYHKDFFFHKNPRNQEDYEYYGRCVNRFEKLLTNGDQKLFIMMFSPESTRHPDYLDAILKNGEEKDAVTKEVYKRITKFNEFFSHHTCNYRLLVVVNFGGNEERSFKIEKENNIDLLVLNTLGSSNGVSFGNTWNIDNLYFSGLLCEHYNFTR